MYKNRLENGRIFLWKFHSFIFQTRKITKKYILPIYLYTCYFEFSCSGFPHSQDNRAWISKNFLSFFTLFFYTYSDTIKKILTYLIPVSGIVGIHNGRRGGPQSSIYPFIQFTHFMLGAPSQILQNIFKKFSLFVL